MHSKLNSIREMLCKLINHKHFMPVCLVLGVVVRVLWIWVVDAPQVSDYGWYYQRALTLGQGRGYSVYGISTAYWSVGYPGFVGMIFKVFGPSLLVAKMV